jgi:ABC-type sugar transport system permease subunit
MPIPGRRSRFALVPAMRLSSRAKKALVAFGFLLPSLVPLVVFTIYPLINSG